MATREPAEQVTLVGAGLVGSLLAIFLARRGFRVRVLERLPDMRQTAIRAGVEGVMATAIKAPRHLEELKGTSP